MGEYILLHKNEGKKANHILFPAPHPKLGKGILVQNTLWGNIILGPTARDVPDLKTGFTDTEEQKKDVVVFGCWLIGVIGVIHVYTELVGLAGILGLSVRVTS